MTPTTPSVFVIGAGCVATALAGALQQSGGRVIGLWARRASAAQAAGAVTAVESYSGAFPESLGQADCILIAVSDEAITEVSEQLSATGLISQSQVMLHCSGAISAEEALVGPAQRGLLHPLRAIPDGVVAMGAMAGTTFGIEGSELAKSMGRRLVNAMGGVVLELEGQAMPAYHAAAVMASNYLVALVDTAAKLLEAAGVDKQQAVQGLAGLAEGALANIRTKGLPLALTGPIRRGEKTTVVRHLAAIERDLPGVGKAYRELGRRTVALARQLPDCDDTVLDEITELLATSAADSD